MNPVEVAGIAAMSPTGRLTTNPVTGQPEAFLPLLFGGLGSLLKLSPLMTGALTGIGTAAVTGDLKRGLISGLTAGFGAAAGDALNLGEVGAGTELGSAIDAADDVVLEQGLSTTAEIAGTDPLQLMGQTPTAELAEATGLSIEPGSAFGSFGEGLEQLRGSMPDALTQRPDFLKNVAPNLDPTFTQAMVPAVVGQSTLEEMDMMDRLKDQRRQFEQDAYEDEMMAFNDLQSAYAAAQPNLGNGCKSVPVNDE